MAPQSSALQQCFDEVADSAPMALERCLDHVVAVLQDAECASARADERLELGDAWRELLAHRAAWCQRYPDELRAAFKTVVEPKPETSPDSGRARREPLELALVDDADIMQEIESSRLVRYVTPLVEQPVSELDALVSSAMGLGSVRPELNPVRPEVFAQTLRALIGHSQVKATTGTLWMKYMAEPLGEELQHLYGRLVTQFKSANVQPADYRSARAAPSRETHAAGAGQDAPAGATAPRADIAAPARPDSYFDSRQISHALLREFLDGSSSAASQALPASYYTEAEEELAQLRSLVGGMRIAAPPAAPAGYRELPAVERPQLPVGVQSTLSPEVWGDYANSHQRALVHAQLRKEAMRVAQVLGLELVRKVVNQIAQDPRLLAPVREAIVALEPSLLRLAMVDPRFFSEEQHPGRLLMERVAQRSFRYNDEFSADFLAFFPDVTRCFNGLNGAAIPGARPFEQALSELEAIWNDLDRKDEEQRGQAVEAMRFAELRQLEAEQIARELGTRPDLQDVPAVVQDFLFGKWALVLAHARLTDTAHQIDPHGYRSLISDLLWSVKHEVTLKQPAQLFARVPPLVASLRAGLASIGQEPEENEDFFQELMNLHHPVLKLRRAKSRRDAREAGIVPLSAVDRAAAPAAAAAVAETNAKSERDISQPWMSPDELDALGFEETLPTDLAELEAESGSSGPAPPASQPAELPVPAERQAPARPAQAAPDVDEVMASLREGDWFDLYSKRRWLRAQLIWASSKATLFMFVSHGGRPHSMTKRVCERLIGERYLRPVRMHGVVSRALDTLEEDPGADPQRRPLSPAT
jgi:uncharacterized protein DUF1631